MKVHKNNSTQTDYQQYPCELFRSCFYDPNKKRNTTGFQTFDTGPLLHSLGRTTKKNLQNTKDHIATFFNPFMLGGNKRAYILKQTCI